MNGAGEASPIGRWRHASAAALAAGLALPGGPSPARAQPIEIRAEVDNNTVPLDGQVVLTVTVSGPQMDLPDPQLPDLPNFTAYDSGRSQNFTLANGRIAASNSYTYVLTPRFVGKSTIGPISVAVGGQRYITAPIEVQVVRPSQAHTTGPAGPAPGRGARPPPAGHGGGGHGPDVFVSASVDKTEAVVDEQITLTVRFHTAVPLMGNPQYTPPKLEGFIAEDLPPERHGQLEARGRMYQYSEMKTALFAVSPGKLSVGQAVVRCQVQTELAVDPFAPDFFQKFFSRGLLQSQTQVLATDRIAISVAPLPDAGKPASFTGAIGEYRVTAGLDKQRVKVGEAVTLTVAVEGTGNLKALPPPKLPEMPSIRVFDTLSSMSLNKEGDLVKGRKEFKTVLVPRASGTLRIPSVPFSFFRPKGREYVAAGTAPIDLEVAPGEEAKAPQVGYVSGTGGSPEVTEVAADIRYVKEAAPAPAFTAALCALSRRTWPHLAPLAAFLLSMAVGLYRQSLLSDPAGARSRRALSSARRAMREAGRAAREPQRAAGILSDALAAFVADKLGEAPSGLSLREALERARARFPEVPQKSLDELKAVWEDLDMMRFAGASATAEDVGKVSGFMEKLLKTLDRELRAR